MGILIQILQMLEADYMINSEFASTRELFAVFSEIFQLSSHHIKWPDKWTKMYNITST